MSDLSLTVYKHQSEESRYILFDYETSSCFIYDDREYLRKLYVNPVIGVINQSNIDQYTGKRYYDKVFSFDGDSIIEYDDPENKDTHVKYLKKIKDFHNRIIQNDVLTGSMISKIYRIIELL